MTDNAHTKARITRVSAERIREALAKGVIPVVAGFQGINEQSDVTTLGRGGSDLTAVALAGALKADRCMIFTDVDGVYTADPNIVPSARRIEKIAYEEMLEMASLGAKVLQSRSVEFAAKFNVPVEVNSSFKEGKGTLVTREDETWKPSRSRDHGRPQSGQNHGRGRAGQTRNRCPTVGTRGQGEHHGRHDHPKHEPWA